MTDRFTISPIRCEVCGRRFMTWGATACHLSMHLDNLRWQATRRSDD